MKELEILKNPWLLSGVLSSASIIAFTSVFAVPLWLSIWISTWIFAWSYFIFKWLTDWNIGSQINDIKNELEEINEESKLNEKYIEEVKEFFDSESVGLNSIWKYVDFLSMKNIFLKNDTQGRLAEIKNKIANIFSLMDNSYSKLKLKEKEKLINNIEQINDVKKGLNSLLKETQKQVLEAMEQSLEQMHKSKKNLENIYSKPDLSDLDKVEIENYIKIIEVSIKNLNDKINSFKSVILK